MERPSPLRTMFGTLHLSSVGPAYAGTLASGSSLLESKPLQMTPNTVLASVLVCCSMMPTIT